MQNASVALQSQEYKLTSPSAGSPLPISGDPIVTAAAISAAGGGGLQHTATGGSLSGSSGGVGVPVGGTNTVLRVIVESLMYPVSLDILHQIFQRFGKVLKIVTFTKNNSFQVSRVVATSSVTSWSAHCNQTCVPRSVGPHPVSGRAGGAARQGRAGRPEHLQRLLHAAHRQQQADVAERQVQQ